MPETEHRRLGCGIELAVQSLPDRPLAAMVIRVLAGCVFEPSQYLGLAHVLGETITKGTAKRDGRGLNDAFDEIGATHAVGAGRETITFTSLCLPECLARNIELHAELIRTPTFPEEACAVARDLAKQELAALEDEPVDLARRLLHRRAYGEPLGRHVLGEGETLDRIGREQILDFWRQSFSTRRMQVAVAGAVEAAQVANLMEQAFEGFHSDSSTGSACGPFPLVFAPGRAHYAKDFEQEQVALCFPGASATDPDFPVERVLVGVLAGGMSGRLFVEVREKQGLVYWVDAWNDQPRNGGMMHLAASSTPQNVDKTYATLLREIDRLGDDLTEQEVERAIVGIVTRTQTQGDITRAKAMELADDLFYYGRPVPTEEKLARITAVTVTNVQRYLDAHPRDELCVVTLGPKGLADG